MQPIHDRMHSGSGARGLEHLVESFTTTYEVLLPIFKAIRSGSNAGMARIASGVGCIANQGEDLIQPIKVGYEAAEDNFQESIINGFGREQHIEKEP